MKESAAARRRDPKGDTRHEHPPLLHVELTPIGNAVAGPQPHMDVNHLAHALAELLARGDGWVRMTATIDNVTVYLKYKFSDGPHRGHYVMAVGGLHVLERLATILARKVQDVDTGALRPARDTPYSYT